MLVLCDNRLLTNTPDSDNEAVASDDSLSDAADFDE